MLAEMGDTTFRLGNLDEDSYADIMTSDALLDPLEESFALSAPMCTDCALEPYCGAEPVFHHAAFGDALGKKPLSAFCRRNMAVCELLLNLYEDDPKGAPDVPAVGTAVITLAAPTRSRRLAAPLSRRVWLLGGADTPAAQRASRAFLREEDGAAPEGFGLYVRPSGTGDDDPSGGIDRARR